MYVYKFLPKWNFTWHAIQNIITCDFMFKYKIRKNITQEKKAFWNVGYDLLNWFHDTQFENIA